MCLAEQWMQGESHVPVRDQRFEESPPDTKGDSGMKRKTLFLFVAVLLAFAVAGCSAPLSQREQGGLIGGFIGAGSGAIIGSTVGHAAAGAAIGGPVGLIAGALIGDQLMAAGQTQQRQVDSNQAELDRLRRENRRLREQQLER